MDLSLILNSHPASPSGQSTESTFHPFSRLPTEIRYAIWELCLPSRRFVEAEFLPRLDELSSQGFFGHHSHMGLTNVNKLFSRAPVLSRVCRDSRQVAVSKAGWLGINNNTTLFLPTDIRYMSWGEPFRIPHFVTTTLTAIDRGVTTSLAADSFYPFRIPFKEDRPRVYGGVLRDACVAFKIFELLGDRKEHVVTLASAHLHLAREDVVSSGLFGHLGDESIALVDATDEEKLRRLHRLSPNLVPETIWSFPYHPSRTRWRDFPADVRKWCYGLKSYWIAYKASGLPVAEEIWREPTREEREEFNPQSPRFFFDEHHPFVKKVLENMPLLKPTIMFCLYPPVGTLSPL